MKLKLTTTCPKSAKREISRLLKQYDTLTVQQDEHQGQRQIKVFAQNTTGSRFRLQPTIR